jgi:hypothetical protein
MYQLSAICKLKFGSVPSACRVDPKLYELLVLVDAIRDGRAREREIAIKELQSKIPNRT